MQWSIAARSQQSPPTSDSIEFVTAFQWLAALYLIPGSIGKGVRLASESLSITAIAAAGVQKSVHLGICRFASFFLFWSAITQYFFRLVWTKLWVASLDINILIIESWHCWVRMARQASWLSSMPLPVWGCKIIAWGLALIFSSWTFSLQHQPFWLDLNYSCMAQASIWRLCLVCSSHWRWAHLALYVAPIGAEHILQVSASSPYLSIHVFMEVSSVLRVLAAGTPYFSIHVSWRVHGQ